MSARQWGTPGDRPPREATPGAGASEDVDAVLRAVRASRLLATGGPVVAMLSGGRDSVCLLDVAVRVCGAGRVHALHVNYGLRGGESVADERHCARLSARLGVPLEIVPASWPGDAAGAGNLQAWAREVRYAAAAQAADRLAGASHAGAAGAGIAPAGARDVLIAAGHTASDQVETILYRLAASPGRRALLGMAPREGRVVRPLLAITRAQTAAYCRARGLGWREDASNASERYARARVRERVVPALRAVHPAAEANVLCTAARLREEAEVLDGLVDDTLAGRDEIALARLASLPPALQRLVVVRLAERAAGRLVPQAGERVAEIVALGARAGTHGAPSRGELHVGGRAGAVVERGVLRFVKLPARPGAQGACERPGPHPPAQSAPGTLGTPSGHRRGEPARGAGS